MTITFGDCENLLAINPVEAIKFNEKNMIEIMDKIVAIGRVKIISLPVTLISQDNLLAVEYEPFENEDEKHEFIRYLRKEVKKHKAKVSLFIQEIWYTSRPASLQRDENFKVSSSPDKIDGVMWILEIATGITIVTKCELIRNSEGVIIGYKDIHSLTNLFMHNIWIINNPQAKNQAVH